MRLTVALALTLAALPAEACRLTRAECRVVEGRIYAMDRYREIAETAFLARGERHFEAGADAIRAEYEYLERATARDSKRIRNEIDRVLQCRSAAKLGELDPACDDAY